MEILASLFNGVMFLIIRCNGLKHLEISVNKLDLTLKDHGDKVIEMTERLSRMEGICSAVCGKAITKKK